MRFLAHGGVNIIGAVWSIVYFGKICKLVNLWFFGGVKGVCGVAGLLGMQKSGYGG